MAFARVPAGEFLMGSTAAQAHAAQERCNGQALGCEGEDHAAETPQHSVALGEYWIGLTEVTNAQFRRFVQRGGYADPTWWTAAGWQWRMVNGITEPGCWDDKALNQPAQPVVCVSWYEAAAYTRWLSDAAGVAFRLPTEAEWEKAARGTDGRAYPWGEDGAGSLHTNFCDALCAHGRSDRSVNDGFAIPSPVGSYPFGASTYGALDMAGNVFEWTASEYYRYPYDPADGRESTDGVAARALRGGSFYYTVDHARCAHRIGIYPDTRNDLVGFRLASGGP